MGKKKDAGQAPGEEVETPQHQEAPGELGNAGAASIGSEGDENSPDGMQEPATLGEDGEQGAAAKSPPGEDLGLRVGAVELIPLDEIDDGDETYKFRAALREGPLVESLRHEGQQMPIVVRLIPGLSRRRRRPKSKGEEVKPSFQLISGFRRMKAARTLGWNAIAAVQREMNDRQAFHASVLENAHRKTYSDIDRAIAIRAYEKQGHSGLEIADLMGLSKRQKNNLLSLLEMPDDVQAAIDDEAQPFSATHALTLKRMKGKHVSLDYSEWIAQVNEEKLSVAALTRALNKRFKKPAAQSFTGIFRDDDTKADEGVFRLAPVKLELATMTADDKARLRSELEQLLAKL